MDDAERTFLADLFALLGPVALRAMFGGHGLYHDGIIIGIVVDGEVYLKTDAQTQPIFAAAGGEPFVYVSRQRTVAMSYWSVPAEAMESATEMLPWARLAHAAALRTAVRKPAARTRRK
ncbi:TfoX/Sxy family protein [Pseudoxanthomonas putridarboris]|uniref:TfoX/Sxy family protein n=1 Tax=Pseudoxanthomonas putridarboris TaxID=752605 RepID=A0ABU9J1P9_9GAMM